MKEKVIIKVCLGSACPAWKLSGKDSQGKPLGYCRKDPYKEFRGSHYVCIAPDCPERLKAEQELLRNP